VKLAKVHGTANPGEKLSPRQNHYIWWQRWDRHTYSRSYLPSNYQAKQLPGKAATRQSSYQANIYQASSYQAKQLPGKAATRQSSYQANGYQANVYQANRYLVKKHYQATPPGITKHYYLELPGKSTCTVSKT
jgi:hypothetical protein